MIPYHVHSHYSVRKAFSHIPELVARAKQLDYKALALTDFNTLSGAVQFVRECNKNDIKPILGIEVALDIGGSIIVLAKNREGWKTLINICGNIKYDNQAEYIEHDVLVNDLLDDNLIIIIGYETGLELTEDNIQILMSIDSDLFLSLEHEANESDIEYFSTKYGIKVLKTNEIFYPNSDDQVCQQIIICSDYNVTFEDIPALINDYPEYQKFLLNNECFLPNNVPCESDKLFDMIETYSIAEPPIIPQFQDANDPDEFLTQLCREGWKEKLKIINPDLKEIYAERIKEELGTFKEFKLSTYMLIIRDIIMYCRDNNISVGLRGSASGCLVSYLIDITDIDPVVPDPTLEYHPDRCLLFSRFINKGRLSGDHISLPDVDIDVAPSFREALIEYVENKYGKESVAHIVTYGRHKGRGCIKSVFRVLNSESNSFDIANDITKYMVDEARVQDELEDIRQEKDDPAYNIINYCIDNIPRIKDYSIEYPEEFKIALQLANTISHQSKHAAGIVITNSPIGTVLPTVRDTKSGDLVVGLEMEDAEYCGGIKFDLLGVAALEKIDRVIDMIKNKKHAPMVGNIHYGDYE